MAHTLSITDGATTVNLNLSSGNMIQSYGMDTAEDINDPKISESMEIMFVASSGPNLQSAINTAELLLVKAKWRQDRPNAFPRVYLQMQVDGEASTWRAEIIEGRLRPGEDALRLWPNFKASYTFTFTRRAWEGPRKELSISANGQSAATGGRTITNNANNWVQIASSQVGGVLPAKVELQLTNAGGSGVNYRNFYIAVNAFSDPANLTQDLGSGSVTLTGSGSNYSGRISYSLSSTLMTKTMGRVFKLIARFTTQTGTIYVKPTLYEVNNLISIVDGDEIYMPLSAAGTKLIDLGSLALPGGGYSLVWTDTVLGINARGAAGYSVGINSLKLMATDSYQYIAQRGFQVAAGGLITFDNIEGVYHTGGQSVYSVRSEKPLTLFPGVTQRINILQDEGTSSDLAKTLTVRVYIRERRLTV